MGPPYPERRACLSARAVLIVKIDKAIKIRIWPLLDMSATPTRAIPKEGPRSGAGSTGVGPLDAFVPWGRKSTRKPKGVDADQCVSGADPLSRGAGRGYRTNREAAPCGKAGFEAAVFMLDVTLMVALVTIVTWD